VYILSIYIKAKRAGFLCLFVCGVVCMLLGDGGLLLCSGGVFFGVRSGAVAWQRHRVFFGVRSGAVAGQRHNNVVVFSLGSVPKVYKRLISTPYFYEPYVPL
jgi:hypothetical protein